MKGRTILIVALVALVVLLAAVQAVPAGVRRSHVAAAPQAVAQGKPTKTPTPVPPTATPSGPTPTPGPAKWTFMVYIVGDNNLEKYVSIDIDTEFAPTGSTADVKMVALADRHPGYDNADGDWTTTKLFYITKNMTATPANAVADWGERNMGDPQTLVDFVQWAKATYPAQHYALILWDHGWSWRPYQAMWDESQDDTLDPHEITAAMNTVGPIDVIGYDACEGMSIEDIALWQPYAQAIAGSEDDFGYYGFEYELVMPLLVANPNMTAEQLATELARSATDWTSSAADLSPSNLITAVDEWSVVLLNGLQANRAAYDAARAATTGMADPLNKDLYDAAKEIKARVTDPTIQARSQAVMDAIMAVRLYEWHKTSYKDTFGIGIFWPKVPADLDEPTSPQWNDFDYYRNYLAFSQLTHWDEFLAAYVQ